MIRINQVKLPVEHTEDMLEAKLRELLKYRGTMEIEVVKRSLDARKKPQLFYVYLVDVKLPEKEEQRILKQKNRLQLQYVCPQPYHFPIQCQGTQERPVIVGTGPAGLFCGYMLAEAGFRPILLERGKSVEERSLDVENFWKT